ncbi:hypothetical protein [Azotobacter chroococcum]|uniref:hypothetical protein n=1 Tax=Azotobacter chroococcum TaxID=353 RepID=UPI000584D126|nr:hypothetical protein [Azotobacter chroococcum]
MKIRSPFPAKSAGLPRRLRPLGVLGLTLLLAACAHQDYDHPPEPRPAPTQRPPVQRPPAQVPRQPSQTIKALPSSAKAATPQQSRGGNHPRYAPPPDVDAYWDNSLGVYVVKGRPLYYRERLYYRWNDGWYSSGRPNGPWETVEGPSVPPGLRSRHPAR